MILVIKPTIFADNSFHPANPGLQKKQQQAIHPCLSLS